MRCRCALGDCHEDMDDDALLDTDHAARHFKTKGGITYTLPRSIFCTMYRTRQLALALLVAFAHCAPTGSHASVDVTSGSYTLTSTARLPSSRLMHLHIDHPHSRRIWLLSSIVPRSEFVTGRCSGRRIRGYHFVLRCGACHRLSIEHSTGSSAYTSPSGRQFDAWTTATTLTSNLRRWRHLVHRLHRGSQLSATVHGSVVQFRLGILWRSDVLLLPTIICLSFIFNI